MTNAGLEQESKVAVGSDVDGPKIRVEDVDYMQGWTDTESD